MACQLCAREMHNWCLNNRASQYFCDKLCITVPCWQIMHHSTLLTTALGRASDDPTSNVAAGFSRHGTSPPYSNPDLWPFDLETGMRVASKVGNLPSKFGHARPLGSWIICCVRDGWTDRQTKATLIDPLPIFGGIIDVQQNAMYWMSYVSIQLSVTERLPLPVYESGKIYLVVVTKCLWQTLKDVFDGHQHLWSRTSIY